MKTSRHTASACPYCGDEHDASTALDAGETPQVGDVCLCFNCGAFLQYGIGLVLAKPSISEADILLGVSDSERQLMVKARELIKQRGKVRP